MKKKILIVEDEAVISLGLQKTAKSYGFEVIARVSNGEEAIKEVKKNNPDLIIMDIRLNGELNGIQTANQINSQYDIPIIFISGTSGINDVRLVKGSKPIILLKKPIDLDSLRPILEKALE